MSGTQTFTTPAGATYSYTVETGENGEAVYDLSRVFQDAVFPIGTVVVHPNYELDPAVAGLVNIQFGKGSTDRHERTDVPMLGDGDQPYVVGHHLVNPADLTAETDTGTAPLITFRRTILAAAYPTNAPSERATKETFAKVQDLVTGLIATYQTDKETPAREAAYAKFLDTKRAEAVQHDIDKINAKIQALQLAKAELTDKLNGYKTN
ncbi:hypothetical protein [Streptomyces griseoaurantiacus]|uniref:hypothetical protein n=1 Tax=Streptomyces griseoaurantiacus TaxID=68213 RepID=UPI003801E188